MSAIEAVIFDWGGTLTRWHDTDFHAESLALAALDAHAEAHLDLRVANQTVWARAKDSQRSATIADVFTEAGLTVLYDDRPKVAPGVKFKDAELLGMPTIVTVGRGLAEGTIEVRDRRTGEREEVPVAEAGARVLAAVRG